MTPPTNSTVDRPQVDKIPAEVWRLSGVIAFGAFLSGLDASLVNIGLDHIGADLDASLGLVQWVTSAYLIALAVSLPVCGWLGRRVGVGRLWLGSLTAFTVASGLCALAPDVHWLIVLRVLQGLAAGLLIPAGQTIIGRAAGPGRLGRVMATLGIAVSVAPAVGPTVGGLLLEHLSWPWLFLVNVPVGAVAMVLAWRLVPRGAAGGAPDLDWAGLALVSIGLPLVVYGVTRWGEQGSLSASTGTSAAMATVVLPLAVGLLGLGGFVVRSMRRENPLLDLGLFRNRVYAAASGSAVFSGAAMFGAMLLLPLYFQILRGQSAVATGLSLLSIGIGTAIVLPLSGRLTDRHGGGAVALWGNACCVVTTMPFAFVTDSASPVLLQGLLLARGAAIGLAVVPAVSAAYAAISTEQLPDATTQVNILQRVGGAVGSALFAVILARELAANADGADGGAVGAFHTAFWWLTGSSVLALAGATWLWFVLRRQRGRSVVLGQRAPLDDEPAPVLARPHTRP